MKILYVANERRAAQLAAHALRNIAPDVKVTWAGSLSPALRWVQENTDVAALIVEAEVQGQGCTTFLDHVRGLGLTIPILIAASERTGAPSAQLLGRRRRLHHPEFIVSRRTALGSDSAIRAYALSLAS